MNNDFIPFALPCIGEDEISNVIKTMRSGWLTTGPKTLEFEQEFAKKVGAKYALAVNSATAGLHLALDAVGINYGDIVITPIWTFTSTAEVSRYFGATPYFIDIDKRTFNINVNLLEDKIIFLNKKYPNKVKAIMPVHFSGQSCDMDIIIDLSKKYNLKIIEDAAHAFPSSVFSKTIHSNELKNRSIGSVGDATVFSFYATKTLATGEGGMITTDDPNIAKRVKLMRLHGINKDVWDRYSSNKPSWYYEVVESGYKYNLTDIASSIGLVQLEKADLFHEKRKDIAKRYNKSFLGNKHIEIPYQVDENQTNAWHLYVIKLNLKTLKISRDEFVELLVGSGIGCSLHFIPLHLQPYWRDKYNLIPSEFPVADDNFKRVISLPIYPSLTDSQINKIIDTVLVIADKNAA